MLKSPVFTLVVGLMVGLALGYVLAERESIPPPAERPTVSQSNLPPGHPPVDESGTQNPATDDSELARDSASLRAMLQKNPNDAKVLASLGNLYYDNKRWPEAKDWYQRALKVAPNDADVMTDMAVVERNLGSHEQALKTLDRVLQIDPNHWQALYNKAIILNFDLHQHQKAAAVVDQLEKMRANNPAIPDLSSLKADIAGKG
ncbi:MAG: tetratricopeptide repeat protein [Acidobacteria bacterium]|nr:tetratricopeptide repeat protein [Acidobacteriota bacterium]